MQDRRKYWKGIEELENTPEFAKHAHNEFPEFLPINESRGEDASAGAAAPARRDFLKLLGFGFAAATLASCEAPVRKAIPYLNKPADVEPGVANWYASTYYADGDYNSILVKTREGRPIKIEPNPSSTLVVGTSPRAQASVLGLYDNNRLRTPLIKGKEAKWEQVDREITSGLRNVNGKVAFVSSTVISPSTKKLINEFGARFANFEHVVYDANSASALIGANGGVIPGYDFSKANIIVGVSADFLGSWMGQAIFANQYITNRKLSADKKQMSRHYQFETVLSVTGANADVRVPIKPSEELALVTAIYNGVTGQGGNVAGNFDKKAVAAAVADLKANRGKALVVSGSNDPAVQTIVTAINGAIGAEGTTIDTASPYLVKQGSDAQMIRLINEMNAGTVGAVFFYNANPAYDHPLADKVISGLKKVGLKVSFAERVEETAALADYVTPDNHYLESWNDAEPKRGILSITQPVISPIFMTRQMQDSLLTWSGSKTNFYDYLRNNWRGIATGDFNKYWEKSVHDGVVTGTSLFPAITAAANPLTPAAAAAGAGKAAGSGIEAVIYETVVGTGAQSNNPWLQEMGDPISKATWSNYVAMPRKMAEEMNITQGDVLKVKFANGKSFELPALIQPGQAQGTVSISMGYGRNLESMPLVKGAGANAFPLATVTNNSIIYSGKVELEKTNATMEIAQLQTHHTIMDRNVVQENTLANYIKNPKEVTEYVRLATHEGPAKPSTISLWDDYEYKNHHWGMVIDLNSCIGCGACTVSCHIENNVPVVGKQEVQNRRDMHWLRIDRYYSSVEHEEGDYAKMEDPAENPSVIFQPMLCQHCNHAPCETVCPVAATMHSSEGINQMAYNRCVGTRYCANNCPYKVRRFNWFAYSNNDKFATQNYMMNSDLGKMVLNPDVTVRARGVMEKCSFCVQRVQLGKLEAKRENRRPKDGEIVTACAQSCPTNAITFGDMLDPESRVSKLIAREQGERAFHVLEELNTQPNVTYLTKIRNLA